MRQYIQPEYDDQLQLLRAIKANDDTVLRKLYQENYRKTEQYVLDNSGTSEDAKDIFQEAFLAVWRNVQVNKFYPENETALAGYLFQISKFKWIDHLRSEKNKRVVSIEDNRLALAAEADRIPEEDEHFIGRVKHEFKKLGSACRDMLTRFYYKKESLRTIAEQTGITEATARNNKYRCLQKLRSMLTPAK